MSTHSNRPAAVGGDEIDCFSKSYRRTHKLHAGVAKAAKSRANRRDRRNTRRNLGA